MKKIKVSAPGKLHLLGEHVVVYGKPAIITAVGKRCFVEITPRKDKKIEIASSNLKASKIVTEREIIKKTKDAQTKWETYIKTNNIALLKSITSDPLDFAIIAIGEALKYLKKTLPSGFKLLIRSDIPIGSGMGSSAAISVSIAGAIYLLFNKKIDKEIINEIAYSAEKKKHGMPSGGDNSAVCFGGLVWFRRETPDVKVIQQVPFSVPQAIGKNFVIIDTGRPKESTGEMVAMVRSLREGNRQMVDSVLDDQERLTRELVSALKNGAEKDIMAIIKAGEANLEKIGVVSSSAATLIKEIEKAGGVAKICGAGGKSETSGVVLAYNSDPDIVNKIASSHNLRVYPTVLGVEGLRQE